MGQKKHRITICTSCKHTGEHCNPGILLVDKLRSAMAATRNFVKTDFEISGFVSKTDCDRPCTIAYQSSHDEIYIFGDVNPQSNITDLVQYAKEYSQCIFAETTPSDLVGNPDSETLFMAPPMMIASENCERLNS